MAFGSTTAASTGFTFGQTSQSNTGASATTAPAGGGGLFGSPAPAGTTAAGSGGSLFGGFGQQQQQGQHQQAGQSAFGAGSIFGQAPNQNQTQPQPFGAGPSLFGSSQTQTQQQQPNQPSQPSTFNFGATSTSTSSPDPTKSLFGAKQPQTGANNAFGQTAPGGLFGSTNAQQQQQQQQQQNSSTMNQSLAGGRAFGDGNAVGGGKSIAQRFSDVFDGMDSGSSGYRMKGYTYNASRDGLAAVAFDERMDAASLREAQAENPDPARLVPVSIVGHQEMQTRIHLQQNARGKQHDYIEQVSIRVNTSNSDIHTSLEPRRDKCSRDITLILSHLISLYSRIALMSQLMRSNEVSRAEEEFGSMLEKVVGAFEKTGSGGRLQGRLAEDWGKIMAIRGEIESGKLGQRREGRTQFLSDETLIQALDGQTQELGALTNLTKDLKYDSQVIGVLAKELL